MTTQQTTLIEEIARAARGVAGLVIGDRTAPGYFDFSQRGLYGSFIALLVVTGVELLLPGVPGRGPFVTMVSNVVIYALIIGATALFLRQIGRRDALGKFVIAINWVNAVLSTGLIAAIFVGLGGIGILVLMASLVISINVGRLIMGLRPMHIILLFLAQFVGILAALLVLMLLFPPTPEQIAEIMGQAGS